MASGGTIAALVTGSVGATLGSIATAFIQIAGHRGQSRAAAADLITSASARVVERLDGENRQLREAILLLTDVLDEVMPLLDAPPDALLKLRQAKRAAQKAV